MDEEQQREREELLSRMFALITMKLEDAAGLAAECQGRRPFDELKEEADKIRTLVSESSTIIDRAAALFAGDK